MAICSHVKHHINILVLLPCVLLSFNFFLHHKNHNVKNKPFSSLKLGLSNNIERTEGGGEWKDWDSDAYMLDDYVFDEGDDTSLFPKLSPDILSLSQSSIDSTIHLIERNGIDNGILNKTSVVYERKEEDWIGWSEEPPYFDDEDIEEATIIEFETDRGKSKPKFDYGIGKDTTDLWTKRSDIMDVKSPIVDPVIPSSKISTSDEVANRSDGGNVDKSYFEMKLFYMEKKIDLLTDKIKENRSINDVRIVLYIIIGLLGYIYGKQ